jgi:hypothetical protein
MADRMRTSNALWIAGALAAAAPVLTAPAAQAAVFDIIRSSDNEVVVLDPSAIETIDGGFKRAWNVSIQKNLGAGGPQQSGYVRTLNEYDCAQRRMRWRSLAIYSRFGAQIIKKDNPDTSWNPADGNGEAEAGLRVVCDGAGGGAVVAAPSVSKLVIGLMQTWDEAAPLPPLQPVDMLPAPGKGKKKPAQKTAQKTSGPAKAAAKKKP